MAAAPLSISIVTPTFRRPTETVELLANLRQQTLLPLELILVDGAPPAETATEEAIKPILPTMPFPCHYIRHGGGTAIQRNVGLQQVRGELVALIDDDIRLEPDFLAQMERVFAADPEHQIGGVTGFRTNQHFDPNVERWRWYRRLKFFSTYEPGRYDFDSGYPINVLLHPPFDGVREVDFMTTSCTVWRRAVFAAGMEFDPFFRDYGTLEDTHFALRARRKWKLLLNGAARCLHLQSPHGRVSRRRIGYKCVVNYYFVFTDIAGPLTWAQKWRFWRFQLFELFRVLSSAVRRWQWSDAQEFAGRLEGFLAVARGVIPARH